MKLSDNVVLKGLKTKLKEENAERLNNLTKK